MTGIQPELWIGRAAAAVSFYQAAFGARVLHQVGEGDEIVAQLAIGDAYFWVSSGGADGPRFSPEAIGGATGRILLVVDEPDAVFARAVEAGATAASEMGDEHGWRLGRLLDPFGHEWEIGQPVGRWPSLRGEKSGVGAAVGGEQVPGHGHRVDQRVQGECLEGEVRVTVYGGADGELLHRLDLLQQAKLGAQGLGRCQWVRAGVVHQ